jgi:hypothetical protein
MAGFEVITYGRFRVIAKDVVNRRHRFLTNDVAKASFKFVLK